MRRIALIIAAVFFSSIWVQAQDLITKRDGQDIKGKVLEISANDVKYKLYDEPDGPTYVVKKSEILMIRFESGRDEVFNQDLGLLYTDKEPVENVSLFLKYRHLKHLYNYKEFTPSPFDRYSPTWSGVASLFLPGLGQMICNEAGRGFAFLGGYMCCYSIGALSTTIGTGYDEDGNVVHNSPGSTIAGMVLITGALAINVISIIDATRVAKVKNMYEQDLRKQYSLEMNVYPSFNYAMMGNTYQPTAGLTLAVRF